MTTAGTPRVMVAVCTFNRHEPLAVLLEALVANSKRLAGRASVTFVVVDDSVDGNARHVVARFADRFELAGLYRLSGRQNIALARNMALETAIERADWIAMTDDDCEPAPGWLEALLDVQQRTSADAVTGTMKRRAPPGSPRWLTEEPFLASDMLDGIDDGAELRIGATHNSLISSRWLKEHPHVRFDPAFGVTGGEDPVFYRTAHAEGLRIHYSLGAVVYENEPPSRATLRYQLRTFFWLGNSCYRTNVRTGVHPLRMFVHGGKVALSGLVRPFALLARRKAPQLRYGMALMLRGVGVMIGLLGVRVRHK